MGCCYTLVRRQLPAGSNSGPAPSGQGRTSLITTVDQKECLFDNRECDARTAMIRGMCEYLEDCHLVAQDGTTVQFNYVVSEWAEPERGPADYPSGRVGNVGGVYDSSKFSPGTEVQRFELPRVLIQGSELVTDLVLEIWASNPEQRSLLVMLVEDALLPVDWMYGARLMLPHYFGAFVEYSLERCDYLDDDGDDLRRNRKANMTIHARMGVLRPTEMRKLVTRVDVQVRDQPPFDLPIPAQPQRFNRRLPRTGALPWPDGSSK